MLPPFCFELVVVWLGYEETRTYVIGENSRIYDENKRQLTTLANTRRQAGVAAVAEGRNF